MSDDDDDDRRKLRLVRVLHLSFSWSYRRRGWDGSCCRSTWNWESMLISSLTYYSCLCLQLQSLSVKNVRFCFL